MRMFLRRFRDDEKGVVAIELLIMTPILVWALLSTFVYFDAFRVEATSSKASVTIADLFSREGAEITPEYIDGAHSLLRVLIFEETSPDLRVTVYTYDLPNDEFIVLWSQDRGYSDPIDDDELESFRARLPIMGNADTNIIVETRTEYTAPISVGLGLFEVLDLQDKVFDTFTVIRPREERLCWDADSFDTANTIICTAADLEPGVT